jgi:hypothetical protein
MTTTSAAAPDRGALRGNRFLAMAIALILAVIGVIGSATGASAAPTVTYPGAIDDLVLEAADGSSGPLTQRDTVKISGTWAVPDRAVAGQTFGMTLPKEFQRYAAGSFDLPDDETGEVLATCQVADGHGPDLVCTLTAAVDSLENVGGTFWMEGTASGTTDSETVEFDTGNTIVVVDLPGEGGIIDEDTSEPTEPFKYGTATATDGVIEWTIGIPSSYVADGGFTIADQLDMSSEYHHYTGTVRLDQHPVENGKLVGDWSAVGSEYFDTAFAKDGRSFEFTAHDLPASGFTYRLHYDTQADGMVLNGDVFGNTARVNSTETSSTFTVTESGGGDGSGDQYTRFTLTKAITGDEADAVRGAVFTVRYNVEGATTPAKTMSLSVGKPVRSDRFPLGSTFVIEEIDLPVVDGVEWGTWELSGTGVTREANGTYEVTPESADGIALVLTNHADAAPVVGSLSWTKVGPDAAALSGSEWSLTTPSGEMTVVDNGEADEDPAAGSLSVTNLPAGEYTLAETKAPTGYDRTSATFTATIDRDHASATFGSIVNTPTPTPPAPPTPTPPAPTPPTPPAPTPPAGLAITGGEFGAASALIALALLLTGGTAVIVGRRRASRAAASSEEL